MKEEKTTARFLSLLGWFAIGIHSKGHTMRKQEERSDLRVRIRKFAVRVIRLYAALPKSVEAQVIGKQMLRSGTSAGAQYHEGLRSRSRAESISKLESALQELEETDYWIRILGEAGIVGMSRLDPLLNRSQRAFGDFHHLCRAPEETRKNGPSAPFGS